MVFKTVDKEINDDLIMELYPDIPKNLFKVRPSFRYLSQYYRSGYGYCSFCIYVIKTNELYCRVCGRMFRRNRVNKNRRWIYTQSKKEIQEIRL